MWSSGLLPLLTSVINVPSVSPVTVLSPPWMNTLRVQLSAAGFNVTIPSNLTILNGFTFSVLDANGWSRSVVSL